jgi:hypothetical protein
MKTCCTCKLEKGFEEFYSSSSTSDGYQRQCKECKKLSNKPEHNRKRCKKYRQSNPEKLKEISKAWRLNNPEYAIDYYHTKVDKQKVYDRGAGYIKKRYNNDPAYKLKRKLSSQVFSYLKGIDKSKQTMQLIGYSVEDFICKHGSGGDGYELDHKIPITWFKINTPVNVVWHLDNLQWIEAKTNKAKGNRYAHPVPESYLQIALPYIEEKFKDNSQFPLSTK